MGDFQIVKYKGDKGVVFEALAKPGTVAKFREGKLGIDNVLASDAVFKNFSKGEHAKGAELLATFGTELESAAARIIIEKGEFTLTAAERKEKLDKRRAEIINYLHRNYINPQNNLPHPVVRLDAAVTETKVRIDPDTPVDRQVLDVMKKLVEIIPMKKSVMEATLTIPNTYAGSSHEVVHRYCTVSKENWGDDGWTVEISFAPGDLEPLTTTLTKVTKGDFNLNIFGASGSSPAAPSDEGKGKGKGKGPAKKGK